MKVVVSRNALGVGDGIVDEEEADTESVEVNVPLLLIIDEEEADTGSVEIDVPLVLIIDDALIG